MKLKLLFFTQIFTALIFLTCSSYKIGLEPWEGISDNRLKITISEFFPFEENISSENIQDQIKEKLNQRASLLIASHISINLARNKISRDTDLIFNNLINETINTGKLVNFDCSENNYCTANAEYNFTELQKNLESINNQ